VAAGGKNIAPQPLENELKLDKFISQAFVYRDQRPCLVALVTPNLERLIELNQDPRHDYLDLKQLVVNQKVQQLLEGRIGLLN